MSEAKEVPVVELLSVIPRGSRVLIEDVGRSSTSVPVYAMAQRAIKQINELTARAEAAEAEVLRLRQGLWDCFHEAGGDTDGDETPAALVSDIVPLAVDCVRDLRKCYTEQGRECSAAEADARRYRWLRDRAQKDAAYDRHGDGAHWSIGFFADDRRHTLDAAIDAELAKEAK